MGRFSTRRSSESVATAAGHLMLSLVIFLFFARGLATVLLYSFIPRLKSLFELSYTEAMLTQLCFFLGYLLFSLPAAVVLAKVGYVRSIVLGLLITLGACFAFFPAAILGLYPIFLVGLFFAAAGITLLQVTSNPLIAVLGPPERAHSRLTLAQGFNSFGTAVGPLIAAWLFFGSAGPHLSAPNTMMGASGAPSQVPIIIVSLTLVFVALIFWFNRDFPVPKIDARNGNIASGLSLLVRRNFLFGAISIFAYVGAEVAVGSVMINYLMLPTVLSVTAFQAIRIVSLYWGGAMLGRFVGSAVLRVVQPNVALSFCGWGALLLVLFSTATAGTAAAAAIIAIGLFNSIMFPTIFALALEDLGDYTAQGSGILCTAIIGGAVVPLVTGVVADWRGLTFSLLVPAVCYLVIAIYGIYSRRNAFAKPGLAV